MSQPLGMYAEGRLSLRSGEGEGEGFWVAPFGMEPFISILSPDVKGTGGRRNRYGLGAYPSRIAPVFNGGRTPGFWRLQK
jgi:hypothetical protein